MNRMKGRKCVVTGGARGIGRAIALAFGQEGADVAILDRNEDLAEKTARDVIALGVSACAVTVDVSDEASVAAAFAQVAKQLGNVDVLMNNAGIGDSALVADMSVDAWDRMIAINLRSVFLCTRLVLPGMISQRWGRIISTSSQLAHKGGIELAHYCAAKAGILGFTRSLAYEVARIRHHRQRHLSRPDRYRSVRRLVRGMARPQTRRTPARSFRQGRGNRPDRRPARLRRRVLLHRRIAQSQRRRRHDLICDCSRTVAIRSNPKARIMPNPVDRRDFLKSCRRHRGD